MGERANITGASFLLLICNAYTRGGHMFEIQLDVGCTEPSVLHDGAGVIRLVLSPTITLDLALVTCHERLLEALNTEFQSLFADRDVARTYETDNQSVIIRRA
jgi:hypothetical protein